MTHGTQKRARNIHTLLLMALLSLLTLTLVMAAAGCGNGNPPDPEGTGSDSASPAAPSTGTTPDTAEPAESGEEATETETEAETEAEAETETETTMETATETESRADTETEPETEPEITPDPAEELAAKLRSSALFRSRVAKVATVPHDNVSTTSQGGYTDGTYHYQLFIKKDTENNEENNIVRLVKCDLATGEVVQISDPLPLNHANDLTYNAKRGLFVAVHNNPHRKWVSLIDPETLTIVKTVKMGIKIYSIAYNEARDQYVVGLSGGQTFCFLDADFNRVDDVIYQPTDQTKGYTTQGAACDENFIYFVLYKENAITVYDWDGQFVTLIKLAVSGEPENLNVVDGVIYIGVGTAAGTIVYRVNNLVAG